MLPKIREARAWAVDSDDFAAEMECRRLEVQLTLDLGHNEHIPEFVDAAYAASTNSGMCSL